MNGNPHPPGCFRELGPPRTSTKEQQLGPEKGPFSRQQMPLSDQPPSCGDVSAASWCPSINLGKLPGEQPSPQPAPPAPVPPRPSSIRSLSWTRSETLLVPNWPPGTHPSGSPSLAAVASPSPQAPPRWFPRKGRGRGEFFSLPNQFPLRFINFSQPPPGTHTSPAHTPASLTHSHLLMMPHQLMVLLRFRLTLGCTRGWTVSTIF